MKKWLLVMMLFSVGFGAFFVMRYTKSQDVASKLDLFIKAYVDRGEFSGAVLVAKNGKIVLSKGYGMADYELNVPNNPDIKFDMGSMAKSFTAMAIMQLYNQGLLKLDDKLTKYIPDFPNGDLITIHHLLSHTSGIPGIVVSEYQKQRVQHWELHERIALIKNRALKFNPGEGFLYGDNNYVLLTYIIEKVSGKSYGAFLKENIFDPIQMHNSGYNDKRKIVKNRADGYIISEKLENAGFFDPSFYAGAGALYSTVKDLYLFDQALYTDKLASKQILEKIFTPNKNGYGYGWFIKKSDHGKLISHSGQNPGFVSTLDRYVDHDACVIIMGNIENVAVLKKLSKNLAHILFGKEPVKEEGVEAVFVNPKIYDRYIGTYTAEKEQMKFVVTKENDKLFIELIGFNKFSLIPQSETDFFVKTMGAKLSFVKNESGGVQGLTVAPGGKKIVATKKE